MDSRCDNWPDVRERAQAFAFFGSGLDVSEIVCTICLQLVLRMNIIAGAAHTEAHRTRRYDSIKPVCVARRRSSSSSLVVVARRRRMFRSVYYTTRIRYAAHCGFRMICHRHRTERSSNILCYVISVVCRLVRQVDGYLISGTFMWIDATRKTTRPVRVQS